jgi:hypothetical protein
VTIELADLPAPVAERVRNLDTITSPALVAAQLRAQAIYEYRRISELWPSDPAETNPPWSHVVEHAALFIGFMTAAARFEEPAPPPEPTQGDHP